MAYRKLSKYYGSEQGRVLKDMLLTEYEFEEGGPVDDMISYVIDRLQETVRSARFNYGKSEEKGAKWIEEKMRNL